MSPPPIHFAIDPGKILLIKPSALGDVVHTLPILNLLRKRFPTSHIAWLVAPPCAGILEGHSSLDEIILFDRKRYGRSWRDPHTLGGLYTFVSELKRKKFDLVIDLQGLLRSGWLASQTGAKVRLGFANARELGWLGYTHRVPIDTIEKHAIERYLDLIAPLGCDRGPIEYRFATDEVDRAAVDELLGKDIGPFAVLLPGTNWLTKRWPANKFAELVDPLKDRFGLASVIAGGSDVIGLAPQIPGAINLASKTNLHQLVALLERASVVITNDSGPMHIAAALNKPMVSLFGPTNPVRTGPYQHPQSVLRLDIACSPCYSKRCSHQSCLSWLHSDAVLDQIDQLLKA